jgi:molybdopterin synthase sulfur carrier subunit
VSATVRLPTQLQTLAGGPPEVETIGATVAEVIDDLARRHPEIRSRLVGEDGGLRRFVNVYLDGEDIRFLDGLQTAVPAGSLLSIVPAIAGG